MVVSGTSRPRPRISRKTTPIRGRPLAGRRRRRRSVERLQRQVADREDVPRAELREARGAGRVPGRHQRDAPEIVRDRVDHVRTEQVADADAEQRHRPAQSERDANPRQPVQGRNRAICLLADEIAAAQRDEIRAQRRPEQLAIGEAGIRGRRTAHGPGPEGRGGVGRVAGGDRHVRIVEGSMEEPQQALEHRLVAEVVLAEPADRENPSTACHPSRVQASASRLRSWPAPGRSRDGCAGVHSGASSVRRLPNAGRDAPPVHLLRGLSRAAGRPAGRSAQRCSTRPSRAVTGRPPGSCSTTRLGSRLRERPTRSAERRPSRSRRAAWSVASGSRSRPSPGTCGTSCRGLPRPLLVSPTRCARPRWPPPPSSGRPATNAR